MQLRASRVRARDRRATCAIAHLAGVSILALLSSAACRSAPERPRGVVEYVGSSTVARFLEEAAPVYAALDLQIDTTPESEGGERLIAAGGADLAGIANRPRPETLRAGVRATLIGRDALAVIVHAENPVRALTREQVKAVFTARLRNWSEVGGPDLAVRPFVVGEESATRHVFRSALLGDDDYAGCTVVRPDSAIVAAVASEPGAIGQISFSFLDPDAGVRAVSIDGEEPAVTNFGYPIARPLYLLWREGRLEIEAFVRWTQSEEGQRVVMRHFVGARVVGSTGSAPAPPPTGALVVHTETYRVYDGGIDYYPHLPYDVLTPTGELVLRVPNHIGSNDEQPMRVALPPGRYLVRAETAGGGKLEFLVTVEAGRLTELDAASAGRRKP
jgi:phosphate transport system substrate-binding protein